MNHLVLSSLGGAVSDTRAAMCLPSGDLTDIALENNLSASAANDAVVSSSPGGFADNQRNSGKNIGKGGSWLNSDDVMKVNFCLDFWPTNGS